MNEILQELQRRVREIAARLGYDEHGLDRLRDQLSEDLLDEDPTRPEGDDVLQGERDRLDPERVEAEDDEPPLGHNVDTINDLLALLEERANQGQLTVADARLADQIAHTEAAASPAAEAAEDIVERSVEARHEYGYGYDAEDVSAHRRTDWEEIAADVDPPIL